MTSYRLLFVPADRHCCSTLQVPTEYLKVPLGLISGVEKFVDKKSRAVAAVEVQTKDGRRLRFAFSNANRESAGERAFAAIEAYAFPAEEKLAFAFSYTPNEYPSTGWTIYDPIADYSRMGLDLAAKVKTAPCDSRNATFVCWTPEGEIRCRVPRILSIWWCQGPYLTKIWRHAPGSGQIAGFRCSRTITVRTDARCGVRAKSW